MPDPSLEPIPRSPLYEQVAERLRDFIDAQRIEPGDRLMSERDLAAQLGVSRTSVRQALTALRVQGIVDIRHGDGVYLLRSPRDLVPSMVSAILESEIDHPMIWEVREGIEVQAARLAAARHTDADLAEMRSALDAMERAIAAGQDGVLGDRSFHRAVVKSAHNPLLEELTDQLGDAIDRTSAASLAHVGRPPLSLRAHRAILAAIERCDEDAAADEMRRHAIASRRLSDAPPA